VEVQSLGIVYEVPLVRMTTVMMAPQQEDYSGDSFHTTETV
jgi:hypothetical protein